MLIHCIILILTSFLSGASSNYDDGREGNSTGLIFSKIELCKINSRNEMLKHLELRHKTHREGWKNKQWGLIWWATIPHIDNMVHGFQSSEELIAMIPWRSTSRKVTRAITPLSGKKNYFWYLDHWNFLYQPKAITIDHSKEFKRMTYSD